ncbi:helix-turn-helix domain-containing protein [Paenibacillus thermoaerophilus]|uniref:Helix-turn-helix domain-containing protein n=1 Tax=Paenibacillus thermoaerophilus TaxID=1215385 RepID=A0ABW2V2X2_9BACL|nr:AraC family transcriptional regulator [Paenibacillus thermoaerophilus]TMV14312.1 helix-turn-helix domain-containing protein [Paenibacillus thermoaerophilus]
MGSSASPRGPDLRYIDTREIRIDRQGVHELSRGEYPMFGFVAKGSVRVTLEMGLRPATSPVSYGEVFLLPPNCRCTAQNSDKQPSRLILIRFRTEGGAELPLPGRPERGAKGGSLRLLRARMPRLLAWVPDMLEAGSAEEPTAAYYLAQSHLYAIAAELWTSNRTSSGAGGLTDYVLQVKQDMLRDCRTPIDVEEIARLSGVSSARFYREFKLLTGLTPLRYMTAVRLKESLRLLANRPSSVAEVAHAVGYPDELYFSRLFKKHTGLSPTDYMLRAKIRVANLCPVFRGDLSVLGITPVLELPREWYGDPNKGEYIKRVEQCRPDVIFTAPVPDDVYAKLSQICPVVMIQWKGYSWKERLLQISGTLGLSAIAERWLAVFRQKIDNARLLLRRHLKDRPFLVVSAYRGPFYRVYGMKRIKVRDLFYDELHLTPPEAIRDLHFLDANSLKDVAALDCDHVIFLVPETMEEEECIRLEEDWLQLKRSRRKKHIILIRHEDPLLYNASFYDTLVDQFVTYLAIHRLL